MEKSNENAKHWSWKHPETLTEFISRKGKEIDRRIQRNVRNREQKDEPMEVDGEEEGLQETPLAEVLEKELEIWDKSRWVQRWLDLCPKKTNSTNP